ncbi:MAG: hypothetical protein ACN6RK_17955 [Stenotrophomonas sp.]
MTLSYRAAGTLLVAMLAAIAGRAQAHSLDDVRFTGPLLTPGPSTLPQGRFYTQPYLIQTHTSGRYDNNGDRHTLGESSDTTLLSVMISAGFTDNLTGELVLDSARSSQGGQHSDGFRMADGALRLRYLMREGDALAGKAEYAVMLGQSLPTGRYDGLGGNLLNGQGSGVSRSNLSVLGQNYYWLPNGRPLRWRWQARWSPSPRDVSINGASVYGTDRSFRGHVSPGPALSAALGLEYSINHNWALAMDLTAGRQSGSVLNGSALSVAGQREQVVRHDGASRSFSIAPALEYNVNQQLGFLVGVQASLPGGRNSDSYISPQASMTLLF